jgi:serine/threonine protein kinase
MKPENVLVTYTGDIKIMDFGLARRQMETSMITSPGTFIGTVVYTSPEQAAGKEIDPRSDVYAIGVMLFEMLTGKLPFKGEDPIAVLFQHIHNEPPLARDYNRDIPQELEDLIRQALSKDPEERPQSALAMARQLAKIRAPLLQMEDDRPPADKIDPNSPRDDEKTELLHQKKESGEEKSPEAAQGDVQVTYLLVELVDFNSRTENIDYMTVQKFLDEFNRRLEDEVLKYGGKRVSMSGGPQAFYIFRANDEARHSLAAVESARMIQRSVQDLREISQPDPFSRISLKIGIQTDVLPVEATIKENLPKMASKPQLYHTATLIQSLSRALPGNSILICGKTFEQIKNEVPGTFYKKIFARGKMEPVFVYRIPFTDAPL